MTDDDALVLSLLRNDLEGHLALLLLEATGEGRTSGDDFTRSFAAYPQIRVLHVRLSPDAGDTEIESTFSRAVDEDVDVALVWAGTTPDDASAPAEPGASYRSWPQQALAAAESINLFEKCLVALIGEDIQPREARLLGYEDGFMASMPLDSLVARLAREAVARREARRRGSSPPCFL